MKSRTLGSLSVMTLLLGGVEMAFAQDGWRSALRPAGESGTKVTLANNGRSSYRIVLPSKPTTQEEKAAEELQRWLGEMTGATLKIVRESGRLRLGPHYISIGRTRMLEQANRQDDNGRHGGDHDGMGKQALIP
ncbi:MAG TPA: hypothetical protein PKH07_15860, partial [bacterium]|nr:hypothetical protein [bacterium]